MDEHICPGRVTYSWVGKRFQLGSLGPYQIHILSVHAYTECTAVGVCQGCPNRIVPFWIDNGDMLEGFVDSGGQLFFELHCLRYSGRGLFDALLVTCRANGSAAPPLLREVRCAK